MFICISLSFSPSLFAVLYVWHSPFCVSINNLKHCILQCQYRYYITRWANPAVELESTAWITVDRWSWQPFSGVWGQCASLCATIVQKTAAVVIENIRTSRTTHLSRHADQLMLWKWIRNWTDTGVQQIFFYVLRMFKCIVCIIPETSNVNAQYLSQLGQGPRSLPVLIFYFCINFTYWNWRIATFISK